MSYSFFSRRKKKQKAIEVFAEPEPENEDDTDSIFKEENQMIEIGVVETVQDSESAIDNNRDDPLSREHEEQRCMRIDDIQIGQTIREVSEKFVNECAESIEQIGLLNPITVNEAGVLVTGRHRLEAYRKLNRETIPVTIISLTDQMLELAQIDENLIRNNPTQLEQSNLLKRRKEIYEGLYPATISVRQRGGPGRGNTSDKTSADKRASFVKDTAEKMQVSPRTVHENISIANNLTPETQEIVRGTQLENKKTDLLGLSQIKDPQEQVDVAKAVVEGKVKSVKSLKQSEKPQPEFEMEQVKMAINKLMYCDIDAILAYIPARNLRRMISELT